MYFADLTPYTYHSGYNWPLKVCRLYPHAVNVGFLDGDHPFPKTASPMREDLLDALFAHCLYPIHVTMGSQTCHFCNSSREEGWIIGYRHGKRAILDNGEILVVGRSGQAFIGPVMIYHYVTEHQYQPPEMFLAAVLESDPQHGERIDMQGWKADPRGRKLAEMEGKVEQWLRGFDRMIEQRRRWQENVPRAGE